ncbi:hypothetical protein [Streptomyces sp. NPDC054888]
MYLVQLTLEPPGQAVLPPDVGSMIQNVAPNGLQHITVHTQARPRPAVSLFLCVATLDEAEVLARHIWGMAQEAFPQLAEWRLLRAEVPLHPFDL